MKIHINSLKDTEKIGSIIGQCLVAGTVLCLDGDLGAGKTTLTQSIAKGLGIEDYVTSPTFTIIKEYNGRLKLNHMDVYRIESEDDMIDLGYDEYINPDEVCIIEWAENIKNLLPQDKIQIYISNGVEFEERIIDLEGSGQTFKKIQEGLKEYEDTRN